MKNYKVNTVFGKENKVVSSHYFDTEKEAKDAVSKYNKNAHCLTAEYAGEVEVIAHHTSIARGYVGVNDERTDFYAGKFGIGFTKHYPTLRTKGAFKGNSYHLIEYFVEK